MMYLPSLTLSLLALGLASCSSVRSPLLPGAVAKDHGSIGATEGPAWQAGSLYFTDGKHINRLDAQGRTTVFKDVAQAHAANGLLFDREGRLVACESGARRVTRTEKDGRVTVLAERFEGERFNTPNDLCMDSQGRIYFTDPRYGPRTGMEIVELSPSDEALARTGSKPGMVQQKQTPVEGVYRIDEPGKITRILVPGAERPNGICITPDDRFLYIADNNNNTAGGSRRLLRYALGKDGQTTMAAPKVIFDWKGGRGPDGMKLDAQGRIYVVAGTNKVTAWETNAFKAGCYILSPSGRMLDFIPTGPDEACNCAFGGSDGRTLFITSGNHLWSVGLR